MSMELEGRGDGEQRRRDRAFYIFVEHPGQPSLQTEETLIQGNVLGASQVAAQSFFHGDPHRDIPLCERAACFDSNIERIGALSCDADVPCVVQRWKEPL